jgi:putative MATE family efflux protein
MQSTMPSPTRRRWQFLREALAGTTQDFTEGSLTRGIALLAIPTILEMVMESTFGVVDAFWVARLGPNAMAAVGLTEAVVVLVFAIAIGLAMAATATVARRIGEHDPEGAAVAAAQAIGLGFVLAVLMGIGGYIFAPRLLAFMHATPAVIQMGSGYARVILGGNLAILMLFLINGIFRGSGDAAIAMRTLWMANLINMALDPCLIYGLGPFPKLGVTGAAVATTTGRSLGVLYQLYVLTGGRARVVLARRHLRIDWPVMARLSRVARSAILQYFIATASWLSLARINAAFGSNAVAGYSLAIRIILFALMPSWGICSAAATLVGQNLGAKRPDRSERAVWLAGLYNMCFLTLVGVVFVAAADRLVGLFQPGSLVAPIAVTCLQYVSLGYPFYAWGMVMEQSFNGAGDTVTPTWINFSCYWCVQIPLAWYLAHQIGPRGVYLAICGAESLLAVVSVVLFRRGKWKTIAV